MTCEMRPKHDIFKAKEKEPERQIEITAKKAEGEKTD